MAETELQKARRKLALWEAAEDAIAGSQEYQIDGRRLTRANLNEVQRMVHYYENKVARLAAGRGPGGRVRRIIPQDL
ncbi:MAG: DUF6148 family protein [Armatimonadota bacterium]|nr:DUF6148 family protein [bacterium]